MTWKSLVPWLGTEPRAIAVKAPNPNNWTIREVPKFTILKKFDTMVRTSVVLVQKLFFYSNSMEIFS